MSVPSPVEYQVIRKRSSVEGKLSRSLAELTIKHHNMFLLPMKNAQNPANPKTSNYVSHFVHIILHNTRHICKIIF